MNVTISQLDGIKDCQQRVWTSGDYAAVGSGTHPIAPRLLDTAGLLSTANETPDESRVRDGRAPATVGHPTERSPQ